MVERPVPGPAKDGTYGPGSQRNHHSLRHASGGAVGITQLLQFPAPPGEQRTVPCGCGHTARYQELRSKSVLTAVGPVEVSRPYYLCPRCHNGRFPADTELDIENMELSPGVRRMQAAVGQGGPSITDSNR